MNGQRGILSITARIAVFVTLLAGLSTAATLEISESHFLFFAVEGGSNTDPQILVIANAGGGLMEWAIEPNAPGEVIPSWLLIDPESGMIADPNEIEVSLTVDAGSLSAGVYEGAFQVSAPGVVNSPQAVTVQLLIGMEGELVVPYHYSTIQAAIDAAVDGDRILVMPGRYYENIDFKGKNIILQSSDPADIGVVCRTVIGWREQPIVTFSGDEESTCVLDGFMITGAWTSEGGDGGGISGLGTHATIRRCYIRRNHAGWDGGGIYNADGLIENCIIAYNHAWHGGGLADCDGVIKNCTFISNTSEDDSGLYNCYGMIKNCIVWGNYGDVHPLYFSSTPVYSCYPGGSGTNIGTNPLFSSSGFYEPNSTPETWDDEWVSYFTLQSEAGRWDPNTQQWVYDEVTSPCIDTGDPYDFAWQNELWPHGKRINIGAYGGTPQASMSPNPVGLLSDLDHNECAGLEDLALLCGDWMLNTPLLDTDLNLNNQVDLADFSILSEQWMVCEPAALMLDTGKFTFLGIEDGMVPNSKHLTIRNIGGGIIHWHAESDAEIPGWLTIDPLSGYVDGESSQAVNLSINSEGLSAGTYEFSFSISDPNVINSPQRVTVFFIQRSPFILGEIVGFGSNDYGQSIPPAGNDYVAVAAGRYHSLALKSDGSIVGWGNNNNHQATPPAGNDYVAVAGGGYHSLALKSDGSIVGWGYNGWETYPYGQANPPEGNDYIAITAGIFHSLALRSDGLITGWGYNFYSQATPPTGSDYVAIAAGGDHGLALKSDGSIVGWGYNNYHQATPPAGNDFRAIAAGGYHSLALKSDGSIVGWGNNYYGQATPPAGNDYVAIAAGYYHSLALKNDGSIVGWGMNGSGQATPPTGNNYTGITTGWYHSLVIKQVGLIISANHLTFSALEGGSNPDPAELLISNGGQETLNWSIDATGKPDWLSITPTSGSLGYNESEPVTLSVDISGLSIGDYEYTFDVVDPNALNSPQTVTVNLHIGSLVAYWALDETEGTTAADSSGYGHDGTLVDMDPNDWVAGKIGNCLAFDGSDDRVDVNGYTGIGGGQPRTTCAWIKLASDASTGNILSYGGSDLRSSWLFMVNGDGKLQLGVNEGNMIGDPVLTAGRWIHVAAVLADWDSDGMTVGDLRLYIDGQEVSGTYKNPNEAIFTGDTYPVRIGTHISVIYFFSGRIDEVRMYDTALSAGQIALLAAE